MPVFADRHRTADKQWLNKTEKNSNHAYEGDKHVYIVILIYATIIIMDYKQTENLLEMLESLGLVLLGGFSRSESQQYDSHLTLPMGEFFILLASVGERFWQKFIALANPDLVTVNLNTHPFDDFTKKTMLKISDNFGAAYYHPSDQPYLPFQTYCLLLNQIQNQPLFFRSPLNILFHHHYGLWYGLRGLLAFPEMPEQNLSDFIGTRNHRSEIENQCRDCTSQPCITACPAEAVQGEGFDVSLCSTHLAQNSSCEQGCLARISCPYGEAYPSEKVHYLMRRVHLRCR